MKQHQSAARIRRVPPLLWAVLLAAIAFALGLPAAAQEQPATPNRPARAPFDFQGRFLVVASDTDMVPSAYIDGKLGPIAGPDALSIIRLDRTPAAMKPVAVAVTNSVIGPPSSIALTPGGKYAIVIETQGPRPRGQPQARIGDLPPGRTITVVDMSDQDHPRVAQQVRTLDNPLSVSIDAEGDLVAVVFKKAAQFRKSAQKSAPDQGPPGRAQRLLALYRFQQGRLSALSSPDIPEADAGDALVSAEFSPKELSPNRNILGLVYTEHPRLALVRVDTSTQVISLSRWGEPVALDIGPFLVRFTPDGRFALVNAMLLGSNIRGTVSSIRVAQSTDADGTPHHILVSRVEAGASPEGLAISPDERWVATTNLERSAEPLSDPKQGFFSSVSLLRLDPQSGSLERVGEFPFDGMLPESAVFDNTSRFLAVTDFSHFGSQQEGGSVDFWRIAGDYYDPKRTELVKMDFSIPVSRGPQSMVIVR